MARRAGRKGSWLVADDTTGFTRYNGDVKYDFWNNLTAIPLARNLQEVASPLLDPYPVPYYRGPQYEQTSPCIGETQPIFIGNTNIRTPTTSPATQALDLSPAIPDMVIGCTFIVY